METYRYKHCQDTDLFMMPSQPTDPLNHMNDDDDDIHIADIAEGKEELMRARVDGERVKNVVGEVCEHL